MKSQKKWGWLQIVLLAGLTTSSLCQAAWVGTCHVVTPTATILDALTTPRGENRALVLTENPLPECPLQKLPVDIRSVVAGRLLPPAMAKQLQDGFILSYEGNAHQLAQAEIIPHTHDLTTAAPPPIILGNNLLASSTAQIFGNSDSNTNRVSLKIDPDELEIQCQSGDTPAGVLLHFSALGLPREIPLTLKMQHASEGTFSLGLSDQRRLAGEDPLLLVVTHPEYTPSAWPIPDIGLDRQTVQALTVLCPNGNARTRIRHLSFEPSTTVRPYPARATWIWNHHQWTEAPNTLFENLNAWNIRTLFITIPVNLAAGEVDDPDQLAKFVSQAKQRGIEVWAVMGDPQAVIPQERRHFIRRVQAISQYNQQSPLNARLTGIQYDIEPYLNAGYRFEPARWLEAYLDTLHALKEASTLPMDLAVPFFWAGERTPAGQLLDQIAQVADSLTVMAYRTEAPQIRAFAQPFLEWGKRMQRTVRIALEAGPMTDTRQEYFSPTNTGSMVLLSHPEYGVLLQLREPASPDGLYAFQANQQRTQSGKNISFENQCKKLLDMLPDLEQRWGGWPEFSGIALHEILGNRTFEEQNLPCPPALKN